ncbi:MAG: DUF4157 domain-containing protein [Pseudomonadota bacterium]
MSQSQTLALPHLQEASRSSTTPATQFWAELHQRVGNQRAEAICRGACAQPQDLYLAHLVELSHDRLADTPSLLPWNAPSGWLRAVTPLYRVAWSERLATEHERRTGRGSVRIAAGAPDGPGAVDPWGLSRLLVPSSATQALAALLRRDLPHPAPAPLLGVILAALEQILQARATRAVEDLRRPPMLPGLAPHPGLGADLQHALSAVGEELAAAEAQLADPGYTSLQREQLLLALVGRPPAEEVASLARDFAPYPGFADASTFVLEGLWSGLAAVSEWQTPILPGGSSPEGADTAQPALRSPATAAASLDTRLADDRMARSPGRPLPVEHAQRLGAALAHDVSDVLIHIDAAAAQAAAAIEARAFTTGREIFFGAGEYAPGTADGDRLLLHELAHVQQFDEGRLATAGGPGMQVSSPGDATEIDAEARVRQAEPLLGEPGEVEPGARETGEAPVFHGDSAVLAREEDGGGENDDGADLKGVLSTALSMLKQGASEEEFSKFVSQNGFTYLNFTVTHSADGLSSSVSISGTCKGKPFLIAESRQQSPPQLEIEEPSEFGKVTEGGNTDTDGSQPPSSTPAGQDSSPTSQEGGMPEQASHGADASSDKATPTSSPEQGPEGAAKDPEKEKEAAREATQTLLDIVRGFISAKGYDLDLLQRFWTWAVGIDRDKFDGPGLGEENNAEFQKEIEKIEAQLESDPVGAMGKARDLYRKASLIQRQRTAKAIYAAEKLNLVGQVLSTVSDVAYNGAETVGGVISPGLGVALKVGDIGRTLLKAFKGQAGGVEVAETIVDAALSAFFMGGKVPGAEKIKSGIAQALVNVLAPPLTKAIAAASFEYEKHHDAGAAFDKFRLTFSKEATKLDKLIAAALKAGGLNLSDTECKLIGKVIQESLYAILAINAEEMRKEDSDTPAPAPDQDPQKQGTSRSAVHPTPRNAPVTLPATSGQAPGPAILTRFGASLGGSLQGVGLHSGPADAGFAAGLGARAVTVGSDIYFGAGEFRPGTPDGDELLAHELHHAVQRGGQPGVSQPGDSHEREAETFAHDVVAGDVPAQGVEAGSSADSGAVMLDQDESAPPAPTPAMDPTAAQPAAQAAEPGQATDQTPQPQAPQAGPGAAPSGGDLAAKPADAAPDPGGPAQAPQGGEQGSDAAGEPAQDSPAPGTDPQAATAPQPGAPAVGEGGGQATAPDSSSQEQGSPPTPPAPTLESLPTDDLDLISQELAEHQRWSSARDTVGAAGSAERAEFVLANVGKGMATGAATGFTMGVVSSAVGKLAERYCPIPGVGAILAGGMSAYSLLTKDWGKAGETIGKFGQGSSNYEVLANSIASVSEIIDVVQNVMNVIAGVIGVISAAMWVITVITVGVAAPLAGTLSSIAIGITTAAGVLDKINKYVLQPAVLLFRALHTFQDEADPREVEAQGAGLYEAANNVGSTLGGLAGDKVGSKVGEKIADRIDAPLVQQGVAARKAAAAEGSGTPTEDGATPTRIDSGDQVTPPGQGPEAGAKLPGGDTGADPTVIADANTQHSKGLQALKEQFQAHRQSYIDLAVDRQIAIEQAAQQAMTAKAAEIEAERQARHDEIDKDKAARDAAIEESRPEVEGEATRTADEHLLADKEAALAKRDAAHTNAAEQSTLDAAQAQVEHDLRQADLDRDYMDKRLLEMETWRKIENASHGAVDPELSAAHEGYLRDLEAHYDLDCQANTQQHAADLALAASTHTNALSSADTTYTQDLTAAQQTHDDLVTTAKQGLDAQHTEAASWADQQKADADTFASGRQGEIVDDGLTAQGQAKAAADKVYSKETSALGKGRSAKSLVKGALKPAAKAVKEAFQPEAAQGRYTSDNATAPTRPADAALFEPVNTERVDPNYADPPGSLEQIHQIQGEIDAILAQRAQTAAAEQRMASEQATVEGQQPDADALARTSQESISVGEQQQQQVGEHQAANQEQQQRQQETKGLVDSYAGQAAGLSAIKLPLKAFQGFTWIAAKIPGAAGAAMGRVNADANKIAGAFASMDGTMASQAGAQPGLQAGLQADSSRLQASQEQAGQSTTALHDASASAQDIATTNAAKVQEAAAAREEAAGEGADLDQQAEERRARKESLAQQLRSWAIAHRQARQAAIAQQQQNTQGSSGAASGTS